MLVRAHRFYVKRFKYAPMKTRVVKFITPRDMK
jgi:hypothetical protein